MCCPTACPPNCQTVYRLCVCVCVCPAGLRAPARGVRLDQRQVHHPGVGQDDAQRDGWVALRAGAPPLCAVLAKQRNDCVPPAQPSSACRPDLPAACPPTRPRCRHADISMPARTALAAGCEGIAAINTITSVMGINLDTLRPEPCGERSPRQQQQQQHSSPAVGRAGCHLSIRIPFQPRACLFLAPTQRPVPCVLPARCSGGPYHPWRLLQPRRQAHRPGQVHVHRSDDAPRLPALSRQPERAGGRQHGAGCGGVHPAGLQHGAGGQAGSAWQAGAGTQQALHAHRTLRCW